MTTNQTRQGQDAGPEQVARGGRGTRQRLALVGLLGLGAWVSVAGMGCDGAPTTKEIASLPDGPSQDAQPNRNANADAEAAGARPLIKVAPATLRETGLYGDSGPFLTAPGVRGFRPRNELWSDGAQKSRWIQLPEGSTIDATDLDHWSFPVGTRAWKELRYLGRRVETRFISRYGTGPDDFLFAAYLWNSSETEATLVAPDGQPGVAAMVADAAGPKHDIPSISECKSCHNRLPERLLGLGAIQSSHDGDGLTLASLIDDGLIAPVPQARAFAIPGDELAQAALGYLHANCSHCHNDTRAGVTSPRYDVRLHVADTTVEGTDVYRTAVNVLHTWLGAPESVGAYRIEGGNPEGSGLYYRTGVRTPSEQMPPLGTVLVDTAGHEILRKWIASLPAPRAEGATH